MTMEATVTDIGRGCDLVYSADEGGWYIHDTVSDTTCRGLYPTRGDALAAWNRAHWRVRDMIPEAAARRRDP